jgi:hypothetical protein
MSEPAAERISVTYGLTQEDYKGYAAAANRRSRSWSAFAISVALFFCAIPVALLFRAIAAGSPHDSEAIERVGEAGLFAFALGIVASWIAAAFIGQIARERYFAATDADKPRTVVLDHAGLSVTAQASAYQYQWSAVTRCTLERGLLLIWVAPYSAVPIPARHFGSEGERAAALAFVRARIAGAKAPPPPPAAAV